MSQGITNGVSPGRFEPEAPVTRGQVVTFLWRMAGAEPNGKAVLTFEDVSLGEYYTDAVSWAVENKITNGMSATTFEPDSICTRGQIVTFLYRAIKEE